jgi:class 3 adenylate cyclase
MDPSRWRLRHVPAPVVDVGLVLLLAIAITFAIASAPQQGRPPDALSYAMGLAIAAFSLFRRRWPVAVLVASAVTYQVYNWFDNPGIFAAVPLSVALATAWAAGHRRWSLVVAAWVGGGPLVYWALADTDWALRPQVAAGIGPDLAMLVAVLLLGEAVRTRRALDRSHRLLLAEQERSEGLLLNILPAPIAARLKQGEGVIADRFPDVTVLFADLVDFTQRSQRVAPEQVVAALNELFSVFDRLAQDQGLEKIKTVGDAYMVAGGLPDPRPDHAQAVAEMALAIREEIARRSDPSGQPLAVRIGIDTGPVVAGVIGTSKFIYDVWGDTVNTASRMETQGVPGCIQVTASTWRRLRDGYRFQRRGPIQVKGKGELVTYFLLGRTD